MIHHTSVAVADYEKSKALYATMLAPLNYGLTMDVADYKAAGFGEPGNRDFWIAEHAQPSGVHVAFAANGKEAVDAFHAAGLAAGATDNGAPGYRTHYGPGYYAAFLHDYDGNNIEAVWFDPAPPTA